MGTTIRLHRTGDGYLTDYFNLFNNDPRSDFTRCLFSNVGLLFFFYVSFYWVLFSTGPDS